MTSLPKIKDLSALLGGLSVNDADDIDSLVESMERTSIRSFLESTTIKNVYLLDGEKIVWNPRFDPYTIFCYHTGFVICKFQI